MGEGSQSKIAQKPARTPLTSSGHSTPAIHSILMLFKTADAIIYGVRRYEILHSPYLPTYSFVLHLLNFPTESDGRPVHLYSRSSLEPAFSWHSNPSCLWLESLRQREWWYFPKQVPSKLPVQAPLTEHLRYRATCPQRSRANWQYIGTVGGSSKEISIPQQTKLPFGCRPTFPSLLRPTIILRGLVGNRLSGWMSLQRH